MLLVAVPAVYRPAFSRLEWDLSLGSAIGAFYFVHLAGSFLSWSSPIATASRFSAVHYYYLFLFLNHTMLVAQVNNCYVSRDIKKGLLEMV